MAFEFSLGSKFNLTRLQLVEVVFTNKVGFWFSNILALLLLCFLKVLGTLVLFAKGFFCLLKFEVHAS